MMFVDYILQWARDKGYAAVYGSPEQVNEMLTNVPFASSQDGTAVIMHLVADSETYNGYDRAIVAVYFASLCPFDFDGESLLPEQERLKDIGKALLTDIRHGNLITCDQPRWQYGYDDYAENVAWVCMRVTLTASAADCVPLVIPEPPVQEMIPVPEVAAEYIRQLSGGTVEPTIRGDLLASAYNAEEENDNIAIAFVGVMPPPSQGTAASYMVVDGEMHDLGDYEPALVTEEAQEISPLLAPYVGWYGYFALLAEVTETRDFCVKVGFEGVYESPDVCWEE